MIRSVSSENGTSGRPRVGRLSGSSPSSPTVGTSTPTVTVNTVSSTMATSGAGTTVVSRGSPKMTARPTAASG